MTTLHRQLLDEYIRCFSPQAEFLRDAKICITGASGFLAASLLVFLEELNQKERLNIELHANARRSINDVPLFNYLKTSPQAIWTQAAVEEVVLPDIDDLIVIHTASYGSPRDYLREPITTYSANTQGLIRLMTQRKRLRQFVFISSAEIYGQPPNDQIPTPENYIGGLDTLSTRSIYGESKRMAEVLGVCLGELQETPFTVLRPWNIYGPGQRLDDGRVPVDFIRQARQDQTIKLSSNGTPQRAFCYVWDAILQLVSTLGQTTKAKAFNIGNSSEEISILHLAQRCALACGLSEKNVISNPHNGAVGLQRCAPDISAIQSQLKSAHAFTPLDLGLSTLIEWNDYLTP